MPSTYKTDAVVIGAGVIGASIAWHLCRRGVRTALLDRGDIASGSSGACDGLVFLQSKKPGVHLELAMESRERFDALGRELPVPIEYRKTGGLVIIETGEELAAMERFVEAQRGVGLDVTLLNAGRVRKLEPCLSNHIKGAAHSTLDGQVNPMALAMGFALGAKSLGARLAPGETVVDIETTAGRVSAVETPTRRYETDVVVNAAGAHAPEIGKMLGVEIPIRPRRGQILVTESRGPMLGCCMISARYIAAKFDPDLGGDDSEGISIEQTENGNFLLGSTREFAGFDRRTTIRGMTRIAARTSRIIPALAELSVIRSFAGLRPYTPDGLPILGRVERIPGFIIAAGHEGDGIALSPITGELIAQMIVEGGAHISLDAFRLERFEERRFGTVGFGHNPGQ